MADNCSGGYAGAVMFAAGTLFGAFLVYLILRPPQQQHPCMPYPQYVPQYVPCPQPPAFQPNNNEKPCVPQIPGQPAPGEVSAYKNNERWAVEYEKDGRVKFIDIIRDAKCLTQ